MLLNSTVRIVPAGMLKSISCLSVPAVAGKERTDSRRCWSSAAQPLLVFFTGSADPKAEISNLPGNGTPFRYHQCIDRRFHHDAPAAENERKRQNTF